MERISPDHKLPLETEGYLRELLPAWQAEVKQLIPDLADELAVEFDNYWLIDVTGTGGFAYTPYKIALAFDPNFNGSKTKQLNDLRGSYFHECYHTVQKFTGEAAEGSISAIENAIYEGSATRFEAMRADTTPPWGEYLDTQSMNSWVEELKELPMDYDWNKWKFYDPETKTRWIMYRTGSYITDEALEKNPSLSIETLATVPALEILKLASL